MSFNFPKMSLVMALVNIPKHSVTIMLGRTQTQAQKKTASKGKGKSITFTETRQTGEQRR